MTQLDLEAQADGGADPLAVFSRRDGVVWWWAPRTGSLRVYHELPVPTGPEYAYLMPLLTYGTPEEAQAVGFRECSSPGCQERRDRRLGGRPKWRRGGSVRR